MRVRVIIGGAHGLRYPASELFASEYAKALSLPVPAAMVR